MDADLQHPPESVPDLLLAITDRKPFVLGTRYGAGVSMDKDWPLHRQIIFLRCTTPRETPNERK